MRHRIDKDTFLNLWDRVKQSGAGEPGFYFTNDKDYGCNPCCEISLRPFQFCNLTEINVSDVETQVDFDNRARAASIIGTLQASYTDFHYLRPVWQRNTEKDYLIGVSMTGIASGNVLK
jgi:ribonucleoside-diphosphate reductase alpha chain